MTTITDAASTRRAVSPFGRLWYRSLDRYPETGPRIRYLTIIVVATIVLYYQLYVAGAVAPSILQHYGMSFRYYVYAVGVVAAAVGAFATILAGLSDRWGRANMVTYGLALVALLTIFGVPNAPTKLSFVVLISAVGLVEGIVFVATPAMIRDFSPQLGRATAMGFWTLGPVVGSLVGSPGLEPHVVTPAGLAGPVQNRRRDRYGRLRRRLVRPAGTLSGPSGPAHGEYQGPHPAGDQGQGHRRRSESATSLAADAPPRHSRSGLRQQRPAAGVLRPSRLPGHLLRHRLPLQRTTGQCVGHLVLGVQRHRSGRRRAGLGPSEGAQTIHGPGRNRGHRDDDHLLSPGRPSRNRLLHLRRDTEPPGHGRSVSHTRHGSPASPKQSREGTPPSPPPGWPWGDGWPG